jgi:hypothetical protein
MRMRIQALFCDYDGTLAPLDVPRAQSGIPEPLVSTLLEIRKGIPVAIVTAKDYQFIHKRTPFADAWSCAYGMETVLGGGTRKTSKPLAGMSGALSLVRAMRNPPRIEYKRTSAGRTCGFCAEWKPGKVPREEVIRGTIKSIRGLGLRVFRNNRSPLFDVIPGYTDKGVAVGILRRMLHVRGGLMYIGDSNTDIPALRASDVGIGVLANGDKQDLGCDFYVRGKALNRFLLSLLKNDFEFIEGLPGLVTVGVSH